jgi:hypothetical protein
LSAAAAVFRVRGKVGADADERFGAGNPAKIFIGRAPARDAGALQVGREDAMHVHCEAVVPAGYAVLVGTEVYLASVGPGVTEVVVAVAVSFFAFEAAALPEAASVVGVRWSRTGSSAARAIACVVTPSAVLVAGPHIDALRVGVRAERCGFRTSAYWRRAIEAVAWLRFRALDSARAATGIVFVVGFASRLDETIAVQVGTTTSHDAATFDAIEDGPLSLRGAGCTACAAVLRIRPEVHVAKELR